VIGCALFSSPGCEPRARPWDQGDAAPPVETNAAALAPPLGSLPEPQTDAGALAEAGAPDAGDDLDALDLPAPVRVGGPWVSCYGSFRLAGEPVKDLTRLSLLCGPVNGMRRLSKQPFEGAVSEGGPPQSTTFEARRGECYRVFAAAEKSVGDLDVTVRSSRGAPIAADHGEDAWPIVQPDRPFCPLEDDRYTVEISARRGSGRFASEVWALRTPRK